MHFSDFPRVGDLFLGRYRVEAVLGAGGFARVYRAAQQDLERQVAIKVMRPAVDTTSDSTEETIARIEEVEERFRREAKVISKFRSPHTVVVHDYGRTNGGLLYMTLEYVDGQTVGDLIKNHSPIDPARVVRIVKQVVRSLHEAHSFDILHRDIKPQNVMVYDHLDQTDLVKVLDFGIAKLMEVEEEAAVVEELTTDGVLVGTPRYMSPEQIRGDRLTPASDVYSLGLVAYEMLTGAKAVNETTTMRIIARHLDPSPLRFPHDALVGEGLRDIVERMISKEPEDRYQSARELLTAFNDWDPDEPVVVPESLEFESDVAETVKFEAQDPAEMAESTEPSDDSPIDEVGETSIEEPATLAENDQEDATLLSEREPGGEEMFFAADTQMLEPQELPDDPEDAVPRAQFLHPTERAESTGRIAGEITGELRQDQRPAWLPFAVAAVAAVLLLFAGVAFLSTTGEDEPTEPTQPPVSTDRPSPEEPSIAAVDPADEMIEVESLDEPDDGERLDDGDDELADDDTTHDSPGEDATSPDPADEPADETADDKPEPQPAAKTTEKDDEPRRPSRHRRKPKEKEKKKEKRRFFPVE